MQEGPGFAPWALVDSGMRSELLRSRFHGLGCRYRPVRRAHLEPRKAPHRDVLAQFAHLLSDQLLDAHSLVLDEGLLQQANLLVELGHLALDDLLDHRGRLSQTGPRITY